MILKTKKQRYNFIADMCYAIMGLFLLAVLLVALGWKWTLGIVVFVFLAYLIQKGMTLWAEKGE